MAKKATTSHEIQYAVESGVQMRNEELGMRNDIAKQIKKPPQRAQRFCNTINYSEHSVAERRNFCFAEIRRPASVSDEV